MLFGDPLLVGIGSPNGNASLLHNLSGARLPLERSQLVQRSLGTWQPCVDLSNDLALLLRTDLAPCLDLLKNRTFVGVIRSDKDSNGSWGERERNGGRGVAREERDRVDHLVRKPPMAPTDL